MRYACLFIASLAAAHAAPTAAEVHKCRGPAGQPIYQDKPCSPGTALRDFSVDPPNVSIIPFSRETTSVPTRAGPRPERVPKPPRRATREKPVFDAAERRHLKEGMSEGEVRARLGPPDQGGKSGKGASWTYLPAAGDPQTVTLVIFDQGRVARVERRIMR